MQKISPFLWFDGKAEQAARYYTSIFPKSRITGISHYDESASKAAGRPVGSILTVEFLLEGQEFVALNGGPEFKFNEAISFVVKCRTQAELDRYWKKLSAGGKPGQCGWLKDKYGVSWQVVPAELSTWLTGNDPAKAGRVLQALMRMTKLDIRKLKQAAKGK